MSSNPSQAVKTLKSFPRKKNKQKHLPSSLWRGVKVTYEQRRQKRVVANLYTEVSVHIVATITTGWNALQNVLDCGSTPGVSQDARENRNIAISHQAFLNIQRLPTSLNVAHPCPCQSTHFYVGLRERPFWIELDLCLRDHVARLAEKEKPRCE